MKRIGIRICLLIFVLAMFLAPMPQSSAAQGYPVPSYGAQPVLQKLENRIPIVIAHKADWRNYPEISLLAIHSSINMGVDMVELDVNITKDGVVVLVHDENIRRMTNATTAITVSSLTWNELKKYALEPEMGNKGTNYILTAADATVLNAIPSYKTYVGTAVSGGTMPFARFDTALELINKRCMVVLDKLTTAERFAACYRVAREADMLDYVLFKNSLDVAGMAEWYTAAANKWNTAHSAQMITAQDVKTSIRYECCTTNRSTLQAHINDGVNLTSVSVGITDANEANYAGDPSELTMRLSFTDANGAVITEERALALYNPEALTYAVSYDGLRATEMRSIVSAAIYRNGERVSKRVEYSIESYGARSADTAMQNLCRAMLAYGDSANALFAAKP